MMMISCQLSLENFRRRAWEIRSVTWRRALLVGTSIQYACKCMSSTFYHPLQFGYLDLLTPNMPFLWAYARVATRHRSTTIKAAKAFMQAWWTYVQVDVLKIYVWSIAHFSTLQRCSWPHSCPTTSIAIQKWILSSICAKTAAQSSSAAPTLTEQCLHTSTMLDRLFPLIYIYCRQHSQTTVSRRWVGRAFSWSYSS